MSDDERFRDTARRLKRLGERDDLPRADAFLLEQCLRRLEQPLRLSVFGTDPRHAISLINLMIGQPVVSPSIPRARIQFLYNDTAYARLQYRDGSQERIEGDQFRRLFEGNPSRVRIYVDLPVLKKISILIAAEKDPEQLCEDVDKTLPAADIALWAGAELSAPLEKVWENLSDRLRDHSYLVLSPEMEFQSWKGLAQEFVEILRVDPRRAQEAKDAVGGVDKEEFRESGGAQLVKTIKKEIDLLTQSALDAGDLLLMRYADDTEEPAAPEEDIQAETEVQQLRRETRTDITNDPDLDVQSEADEEIERILSRPVSDKAYSVQLGKVASRSRLLNSATPGVRKPVPAPRTVSMAIKNMPKNATRPVSKVATKARVKSRKSRPGATPWSLGL